MTTKMRYAELQGMLNNYPAVIFGDDFVEKIDFSLKLSYK